MALQEVAQFILERDGAMVLFLVRDVFLHGIQLRDADRECAVATLPGEILQAGVLGFEPDGRAAFYFLNHGSGIRSSREPMEKMHVVGDSADKERRA